MRSLTLVAFGCFILLGSLSWAGNLKKTQKIAADSLRANEVLKRVATENMANAESAGYAPKSVFITPSKNRQTNVSSVRVKKIRQNNRKTIQKYDPNHPKADENGYVTMPDVNPLTELMNIQETKHRSERALRVYEVATELRHKTIGLISGR
tara:strand:- start:108 stop:563 length:456 start_codon:yes stop_codon:yes gene_type:complete